MKKKPTPPTANTTASSVLGASLLLPGLTALTLVTPAQADTPPEKSTLGVQVGTYHDEQPGWPRITATSPQIYWQKAVNEDYAITVRGEADAVSGASPRMHTQSSAISGASRMHDNRLGAEVKVSRYLPRSTLSLTTGTSHEHDYQSNALALDGRWSSDNNNTTWSAGVGLLSDKINDGATWRDRRTHELLLGVTQTLTPVDIVQLNASLSDGQGYYSDPYKTLDKRPGQRTNRIFLMRWNHHFEDHNLTLRTDYRRYGDSFGIHSDTLGVELVKPVGRWTWRPELRYYNQSAADFYIDPIYTATGQYNPTAVRAAMRAATYASTDQRLSAFGAWTTALGLAYALSPDLSIHFKYSLYRQRSSWASNGSGSPGLDPFKAQFVQIGAVYRY